MKRMTYLQGVTVLRSVDNTVEPPSVSLCDGTSTPSRVGKQVPKAKVVGVEGNIAFQMLKLSLVTMPQ